MFLYSSFSPFVFIQCDNAREFDNIKNRTFFLQHGSLLHFSFPYTSPRNGKAERSLRTLNDIVRTLLLHALMQPKFWAEALHTTTLLLNIFPSKANQTNTSFLHFFFAIPTVLTCMFLVVFFFRIYMLPPPVYLLGRSVPCIILGFYFEHKGCRCLDLLTGHVHVCRHVTCAENIFPFAQRTSNITPTPTTTSSQNKCPFFLFLILLRQPNRLQTLPRQAPRLRLPCHGS
jgi:hypothetical protein